MFLILIFKPEQALVSTQPGAGGRRPFLFISTEPGAQDTFSARGCPLGELPGLLIHERCTR
ncbi:MAG: hypothetical protein CL912_32035 [Deltaproteobacteria bacterium]|nr:hypothetical protein [Deltaproteobacteria bacterium]